MMPTSIPTRRVTLVVDGARYDAWTSVTITRDLGEIAGSFDLELDDLGRTSTALPAGLHGGGIPFAKFQAVQILLDDEAVLVGYIDVVAPSIGAGTVGVRVTGRDKVGPAVDCAAAPFGPVEYRKIRLEALAAKLCEPFGITVRAEVDTGDPIDKVSIDTGETVMSVLEKYQRKRAVLFVSDGIGCLIITRSGKGRTPGDIRFPGNVVSSQGQFDGRHQFSPVVVKGQGEHAGGKRAKKAALDRDALPLDAPPAASADADEATGVESRATSIMGVAWDDEVPLWRPAVKTARAKGELKDADTEAKWWVSTARGKAESCGYTLPNWRANGVLWRPNEMVPVADAYQRIDKDLLIAGVNYVYDAEGTRCEMRVCGREAYDLLPEGDEEGGGKGGKGKGRKGKRHTSTDLDKTAEPL
ncbi:MAG: phage baseplate assembly protein [Siculibacillus sp.]